MASTATPLLSALLVLVTPLAVPAAALAGTAEAESIWDKQNAIQRAMESVPKGAQVTGTSCDTVEVGTGNLRYICRVTYTDPASPTP